VIRADLLWGVEQVTAHKLEYSGEHVLAEKASKPFIGVQFRPGVQITENTRAHRPALKQVGRKQFVNQLLIPRVKCFAVCVISFC
jgi:hypothetical protein